MFAEKYKIGDSFEFDPSKEIVLAYRHQILQCILENPDETLILKLCRICCEEEPRGRKRDKEIDWVGCERCTMYWCHFQCMETSDTLSNFLSSKWFCRFCS